MRIKSFCIYVLFFTFCAFALGSGSGGVAPALIFKSWKAGQGVTGGPSNAATQPADWKTFITTTETTCKLRVDVGYASIQHANYAPLTRVEWKVSGAILLSGLSETELKRHTFTFSGSPSQQGDTGSTSTTFSYNGNGTLSSHWHPTGGKILQRKYCPNYKGTKNPQKGRDLEIKVKFIGYYGSDPNNQQKVEIDLPLAQDEKDQIRQEYVDQTRLVPSRSDFKASNNYNHGHYSKMMDGGLSGFHQNWVNKCNELYRNPKKLDAFNLTDFSVNSGYRHPHHNVYHALGKATHGLHQYGVALDVQTVDVDEDGTVDQVYNNEAQSGDAVKMEASAKSAGADYRASYKKYEDSQITHADWRNDYRTPWPPNINSSGQLVSEASEPEPELPSSVIYACSFHSGAQTLSDNHEQVTPSCNRSEHVNYQCQLTFSDHALQTSCSVTNSDGDYCTATYFYLCDSHTHEYPSSSLAACGIHPTSASGNHTSTYLCNISPCSNRVVPSCLALCPETDNHGKVVCNIQGCQDSTPYDPTSSSAGWHAPCNECSQYRCKGGGHSWYPSCTDTTHTNSNGDSCTAGGYECVSHTPVYPAPPPPPTTVSCGGCSVSYDPQGSLAWSHEYIPCPRTRIAHDQVCGESFYRCSNTNTCIWGWRHSSWNDDPTL